ncbi:MAG: HupE/UreJ family protein [bacterium]
MRLIPNLSLLTLLLIPATAFAHPGHDVSVISGFIHPLTGLDHFLAIVASGLLASRAPTFRQAAVYPLAFVGCMILGVMLTAFAPSSVAVESMVSVSVVVLGAALWVEQKVSQNLGAFLVASFAVFHGFAHGSELGAAHPITFVVGFSSATLALHLAAVAVGQKLTATHGRDALRWVGAAIATVFGVATLVA